MRYLGQLRLETALGSVVSACCTEITQEDAGSEGKVYQLSPKETALAGFYRNDVPFP